MEAVKLNQVQEALEYRAPKYKIIEIYNHSGDTLLMNPLSDDQVKNSGRLIHQDDEFVDVGMIRLQFHMNLFDFMTREFYMLGKKFNFSSYFSVNQFQTGIMDIPFVAFMKDIDIKIPLKHHEWCAISFYESSKNEIRSPLPNKEVYIVIENTSSKSKDVNLIDLAQGLNIPKGIIVTNSEFNIVGGNDFKLLRIWGKGSQITEPIYYQEGDYKFTDGKPLSISKIEPQSYFSANQFQSGIIDVNKKFVITPESEIKVHIASKEKVMYHFLG